MAQLCVCVYVYVCMSNVDASVCLSRPPARQVERCLGSIYLAGGGGATSACKSISSHVCASISPLRRRPHHMLTLSPMSHAQCHMPILVSPVSVRCMLLRDSRQAQALCRKTKRRCAVVPCRTSAVCACMSVCEWDLCLHLWRHDVRACGFACVRACGFACVCVRACECMRVSASCVCG